MLWIGELGCDVELRTAAIAGAPEARADPFKMRVEFDCGIVEMLCGDRIPVAPEVPIFLLKEGGDQHVLGCEMPIEAGLGDPRSPDDQVHPDRAHAVPIEECRGRLENPTTPRDPTPDGRSTGKGP